MAYATEQHDEFTQYDLVLDHSSGVRAVLRLVVTLPDGSIAPEATRDSVFQATVTRLSSMSGATFVSAIKRGGFSAAVTP